MNPPAGGTPSTKPQNLLYYGDNLDVLRRHVKDESVDLVYLDPPFKSNQDYNVLFAEHGTRSAAQISAFEDTWRWDQAAAAAYEEVVEAGGKVADAMRAFMTFLGHSDMMAYLCMMAPRLGELRRVLKPSGSIWLHCDPTAGHYLKMLMDAVFGPANFQNEVTWQRSAAHNDTAQGLKRLGRIHDILLFYTKSSQWTWKPQFVPYDSDYVKTRFRNSDAHGMYKDADLTAAKPGGDTLYEWRVKRRSDGQWTHDLKDEWRSPKSGIEYAAVKPSAGRYWAYSRRNMIDFAEQDRLHYFSSGMPRLKQYASDLPGIVLQDIWTDIPPINSQAQERLGYPTQKPEALLERIILVSSSEGGVVLDPFCGCGTAVAVAHRLNRRWIGIDITHLAINLIRHRLQDAFGPEVRNTYRVIGEPEDLAGAETLAKDDPYQFQWWALGLVGARPVEQRKGADRGIDGRLYFHDEKGGTTKQVILSVKAGNTTVAHLRDLRGVLDRENAEIGVLLALQEPTAPMRKEAASAGFYSSPWGEKYPRLQILTIKELLDGRRIQYPPSAHVNVTFKKAPRVSGTVGSTMDLPLDAAEDSADYSTNPKPSRRRRST